MKYFLCLWSLLFALSAQGQLPDTTAKKKLKAAYTSTAPKIDGILDDEVWKTAAVATDFIEKTPNPGQAATQKSEVRVLYTTEGIYVGAHLYDKAPDSILQQLSVRDEWSSVNADNFAIFIDGMYTQQTNFTFRVTAAGVQIDANNGDEVWDAVWKSAVKIVDDGWIVEIEIPYSQLRFPRSEEQIWGINFGRTVRRSRQEFYWSEIDPTQGNEVQQQGLLTGIERVKPPVRLSFTPYVAGYLNHQYDGSKHILTPAFSAGADMKYGINESFTLDVALVPDFGDVQSDNLVFNLSPFEIFYEERRPFFTEGVELFGLANLFYSRRIGSRPVRYRWARDQVQQGETLIRNPEKPYLINALKVSGRTKKGLGLGLFNAVTAPTFAEIEDVNGERRTLETESFTNYNVVVVDQQFWKHSFVSLINTSVIRFGNYTDAVATGTQFKVADKKNLYGVEGSAAFSSRFLDQDLHSKRQQLGYRYNVSFQKFSGNFRFGVRQQTMSKDYNINDMGFVGRTNFINTSAWVRYNTFKPFGYILRSWSSLDFSYEMLYNPAVFTRIQVGGEWGATLRNFLSLGADFRVEPVGYNDYFEPRTPGRHWAKPTWSRINFWFSSDYRKAFALDGGFNYRRFWGEGAWAASDVIFGRLKPLIRFSDHFNMIIEGGVTVRRNSLGFVTKTTLNGDPTESIIFGSRFRQDVETSIAGNYLFTNKISLTLRLRHYWALVDYGDRPFYLLTEDGGMEPSSYEGEHNTNYNVFNIDLIFRWRFAPGSELNIVWKQAILDNGTIPNYNYFSNFGDMFAAQQNNQFSVKALYFLDFFQVFGRNNRGVRLD